VVSEEFLKSTLEHDLSPLWRTLRHPLLRVGAAPTYSLFAPLLL
jgi:hypothetical protein